jgi:glycosyltransferase involved in cell wall biosynthesis
MSPSSPRSRVLVFAYACEPGRGSEPGAGWGIVRSLASFADCTVLVGPEHTPGIARLEAGTPNGHLTFVEVPEPRWGRFAKHHRTTWFLLYLEWLRRAVRIAWRLHTARPYHLTYHATYSAYWLPSPVAMFGVPSVWGPVGGAVVSPLRLWPTLGARGILGEILDLVAVRALACLPATRRTWRRATVRLVQNDATRNRLPESLRTNTYVLNHAPLVEVQRLNRRAQNSEVLSIGVLDSRKGVGLAIRGIVHAPEHVRLIVVGDGRERRSLEQLARKLSVAHRVEFRGWIERGEVFHLMERAAAAVFMGLREEGGVALAEALVCGLPVIVLAHGGARNLALDALDARRVALIAPDRPAVVARHVGEAMGRFCATPCLDAAPNLDPERSRALLEAVCRAALAGSSPAGRAAARAPA